MALLTARIWASCPPCDPPVCISSECIGETYGAGARIVAVCSPVVRIRCGAFVLGLNRVDLSGANHHHQYAFPCVRKAENHCCDK